MPVKVEAILSEFKETFTKNLTKKMDCLKGSLESEMSAQRALFEEMRAHCDLHLGKARETQTQISQQNSDNKDKLNKLALAVQVQDRETDRSRHAQ